MQQYFIAIPADSTTVLAGDIPNWIADRLVPIPETPSTLCSLQKLTLIGENQYAECNLTPEDCALMDVIFCDLPQVSVWDGITQEAWANYELIFEKAPNKPLWTLQAQFTDHIGDSKQKRAEVRTDHFKLIDDAIKSGTLKALTAHLSPAKKLEHDTTISIDDARQWLLPNFFLQGPERTLSKIFAMQAAEKLAAGRYTLQEAAAAIGANERAEPMEIKLLEAARTGALMMYGPGETARYSYDINQHIRKYYEEAYWDDLNAWIAANEQRMKFRFPAPAAALPAATPQAAPAIEPVTPAAGMPRNDRVTFDELAWETAQFQTDVSMAPWKEGDSDDDMRRTIVCAMNKYGWKSQDAGQQSERPGTLPYILKMLKKGEISARSTLNNCPPVELAQVFESPIYFSMTQDDADKVRAEVLGTLTVVLPTSSPQATLVSELVTPTAPIQPKNACDMSSKRKKNLEVPGVRGAKRRILESWKHIETLHPNGADGTQVLRILRRDTDAPKIQLKTVQNHLSDLRKKGLIP